MSEESLQDRFAARMGALLGPEFPSNIALAVSGGGDSMAMLALSHEWARHMGVKLWVVTVDHGLRSESADEAAMVAAECAALGHPHETLRWSWDGKGNLQDAARRARLELIDRWRGGIEHVLMAHTQDDVAETFLMRLARGSGVEGLSAMAARRHVRPQPGGHVDLPEAIVTQTEPTPTQPPRSSGFFLIRPLLEETRADLRHYIETLKVPFANDASNEDPSFDRARIRAAFDGLGIDAATLAGTAHRMRRAREALAARAVSVAEEVAETDEFGVLRFDRDRFTEVERDTQLRLLAAGLQWVSGAAYRPRAAALEGLLDRALSGGGGTLHGAQIEVTRTNIEVFREFAAVAGCETPVGPGLHWDGRWLLNGPDVAGLTVRALGDEGWAQVPEPRPKEPRHAIGRTLPAVFDGSDLIACPALGFGPAITAELLVPPGHFVALLNPH